MIPDGGPMISQRTLAMLDAVDVKLGAAVRTALRCARAEPACAAVHLRIFAERLVGLALQFGGTLKPEFRDLHAQLHSMEFSQLIGEDKVLLRNLNVLRVMGNDAAHGRAVGKPLDTLFSYVEPLANWIDRLSRDRRVQGRTGEVQVGAFHAESEIPPVGSGLFILRRASESTFIKVEDGQVVPIQESVPGLYFGDGEQVWEWEATSPRGAVSCETDMDAYWDARDAGDPRVAYVPVPDGRFVNLADNRRVVSALEQGWATERKYGPSSTEYDAPLGWIRSIEPLASIGPFLAVVEHDKVYAGGVHNNWEHSFWTADARTGRRDELLAEIRHWVSQRPDLLAAARERWIAEDEERGDDESADLKVTLFRFVLDDECNLSIVLQFTGETYFAASDGKWDGYTRSVEVVPPDLPDVLKTYAGLPEPLRSWVAKHMEGVIGWSKLDAAALDLVLARIGHPAEGW